MKHTKRSSIVCFVLAVSLFATGVVTAPAAVYIYNAQKGTLPLAQGWTVAGTQAGSQSIVGGSTLVVNDTDANRNFGYSTNAFGVTLDKFTEWQSRSLVRILSDELHPGGGTPALYTQYVGDNNTSPGIGARYVSPGTNEFLFYNSSTPARIDVPIGSFYEVVLTKTGTTGTGADTLTLQVFDANGINLLGSIVRSYAGGEAGFGNQGKTLVFGEDYGSPTGTFELKWATFGISELAPTLFIPEPSTMMLGLVGGLLAVAHKRRRG